ncbi:MAG: beta-lactamase family protein, partial [Cytophagales bacterium]|nr:beta-lactamase family protein [Armatimonadota bacterium]
MNCGTRPTLLSRRHLLSGAGAAAFAAATRSTSFSKPVPPVEPGEYPQYPATDPARLGFSPERLETASRLVEAAVLGGIPGAVLLIARRGAVALHRSYGFAGLRPAPRPMALNTIFDLASLTKPVATATAVLKLIEAGTVELDAPVARYLAPFALAGGDRADITIRHLMTHGAGFPAGGAYFGKTRTTDQIVREIANSRRIAKPGERFLYSDFSFITLGAVVESVTGRSLRDFSRDAFFAPLGMRDTDFLPGPGASARCAATTSGDDTEETRGKVHDPTSQALGGVAGHAGLFSTADDLARFCQMLLGGGERNGVRILRPETVRLATTRQSPFIGNDRALGWDLESAYSIRGSFPPGSFGHTGFTGTSLLIDPRTQTVLILLTNAVHGGRPPPRPPPPHPPP